MTSGASSQFGPVAAIYDNLMSVVPYEVWVDYVEKLWHLHGLQPVRVLDMACGTGNVLDVLLERGYEAEGADASAEMLEVARRKLPGVPLWCQDFRTLELPGPPFDAATCLFDSLNYLLEFEELVTSLERLRRHLRPGGILVFDVNSIHALEAGMFDQHGTGEDHRLGYRWRSHWEPTTRLCTISMEFRQWTDQGETCFHETHVQRGYTPAELTQAVGMAGFQLLDFFASFTTQPPTARSDRYHLVVQR